MRRDEVTRWQLYFDESGNFDDSSEFVLIGAVAVSMNEEPFLTIRFREALKQLAPLVPWPFHRWLATKAVMYPLWWEQREGVDVEDAFEVDADQAITVWSRECPEDLKAIRARLRSGKEPAPYQLEPLHEILERREPALFDRLQVRSRIVCAKLSQIFKDVVVQSQSEAVGTPTFLSFLAGEFTLGDAVDDGPGDRYFSTLVCALDRVADVFRRFSGDHVVTVHLASRHVTGPTLSVKMELKSHHIEQACKRATEEALAADHPATVRFSTGKVWRYDEEVSPGIVMADSVANYMWRKMVESRRGSTSCTLAEFHGLAADYFRFLLTSGNPKLSHASATGAARAAVNEARSLEHAGCENRLIRLDPQRAEFCWTATQANQWIEYFQQGGGVE